MARDGGDVTFEWLSDLAKGVGSGPPKGATWCGMDVNGPQMQAKVGDIVTVRGKVCATSGPIVYVAIPGAGSSIGVERADIVAIETPAPKPLAVGDRVKRLGDLPNEFAELKAIDGEWAWVRWINGAHGSVMLRDLVRA